MKLKNRQRVETGIFGLNYHLFVSWLFKDPYSPFKNFNFSDLSSNLKFGKSDSFLYSHTGGVVH